LYSFILENGNSFFLDVWKRFLLNNLDEFQLGRLVQLHLGQYPCHFTKYQIFPFEHFLQHKRKN
jgi:hypothetical protein